MKESGRIFSLQTSVEAFSTRVVVVLYILLNVLLLLAVGDPEIYLHKGADASSWYSPALALLQYGEFVNFDNPEVLMTYRTPLYPLYVATMLWLGAGSLVVVIIGQIILLLLTGVLLRSVTNLLLPGMGAISLALFLFNPNSLGSAHLIQSDTLYAFMLTFSIWSFFKYVRVNARFSWVLLVGLFFGLSTLVRPTGQYIILLLPLIFYVAIYLDTKQWTLAPMLHGLLAMAVSVVVILPWMSHNNEAGWGYTLVTSQIKARYLGDSVIYLEKISKNRSINDASRRTTEREEDYILSREDAWQKLSEKEKSDELVGFYWRLLNSYSFLDLTRAAVDSWTGFFAGGGVVNFFNILSIEGPRAVEQGAVEQSKGRIDTVLDALNESHIAIVLASVVAYLYVLVLRVLGLLGIVELIRRRDYFTLITLLCMILYFALAAIFVGTSRYRLPVEPELIMLALYGISLTVRRRRVSSSDGVLDDG